MNRQQRRAHAATDRAAAEAETIVRTNAIRRGDPMPDSHERLALLYKVYGVDNARKVFATAIADGIEDPIVMLCDMGAEACQVMLGPRVMNQPEMQAVFEECQKDTENNVPLCAIGIACAEAIKTLGGEAPATTRRLRAPGPVGHFFVAVCDAMGISLVSIPRTGDDAAPLESAPRVEKDFGPS